MVLKAVALNFSCWMALLLVNGTVHASDYTNAITGGYNVTNTWGVLTSPGNTNATDNVTITNGTVTINTAYAASNDVITINNLGTLSTAIAFGLSGTTNILNSGGRLLLNSNTPTNLLAGAVVRLNGGTLIGNISDPGGLVNVGGALEVWASSTISNTSPNINSGSTRTLAFGSLDFVVDGTTLTIAQASLSGGGVQMETLFSSVMVSNNVTLALRQNTANVTTPPVLFSNVTLTVSKTLTVTNLSTLGGILTFKGNNTAMVGNVNVLSNVTVNASDNNSLGTAAITVNAGATLVGNASGGFGSANVSVNAGGTANASASNSFGTATVAINSGAILNAQVGFGLGTSIVTVNSGGKVVLTYYVNDTLRGATVRLNGGTLSWGPPPGGGSALAVGGAVEVMDNSTITTYGVNGTGGYSGDALMFDSLNFLVDGKTLTVSNYYTDFGGRTFNTQFNTVTVTNNGTLAVAWDKTAGTQNHADVYSNVTIAAGKTLTITNVAALTSTENLLGSNPGMLGALVIHSNITFNVNGNNGLGSANVTVNGATLNPNVSNAFGTASITVTGATLTSSLAYGLGTSTITVNSGGRLLLNNAAPTNYLAGVTVRLNGGTLDASISGAAGFVNVGGTIQVLANSTITNTAPNNNTGPGRTLAYDSLQFAADGTTLTLFAGNYNGASLQFTQQFSSVSLPYNATVALAQTNSTVNNSPKPITLFSNFTSTAGTTLTVTNLLSQTGRLIFAGNNSSFAGNLDIRSNVTVTALANTSLGNAGTVTVYRGGTLTASAFVTGWTGSGTLSNSTVWHTRGGNIDLGGANNSITTIGTNATVILENGGTLTQLNTSSRNALTVDGKLSVRGTSVLQFNTGQTLTIASGGQLSGNGTIAGNTTVQSGGAVAPGMSLGTLTFSTNFTLTGTAQMELFSGGNLGSADKINVLAALTGSGVVQVTTNGTFVIALGDKWDLFDWTSGTPTFTFDGSAVALDSGLSWDTSQLNIDGTIAIIPEPGTFVMVLLGLAALVVVRRWGVGST